MDFSTLTEDQQKQYQQLFQQFQQHQQERQLQLQQEQQTLALGQYQSYDSSRATNQAYNQDPSQGSYDSYDPSQTLNQTYDQSYYQQYYQDASADPRYQYYNQQQQQQQSAPYYPTYYANSSTASVAYTTDVANTYNNQGQSSGPYATDVANTYNNRGQSSGPYATDVANTYNNQGQSSGAYATVVANTCENQGQSSGAYATDVASTYNNQGQSSGANPDQAIPSNTNNQIYASASAPLSVQTQQKNAFYSQPIENHGASNPVSSGVSSSVAAAVAALSQLTQFAGRMDAAERAMAERQWPKSNGGYGHGSMMGHSHTQHTRPYFHPVIERFPYRDSRSFGRGHFDGQLHPHYGIVLPFRGRGGRIGRHSGRVPNYYDLGPPDFAYASAQHAQRSLPQTAWCDLCRVDCTNVEILEQHKNGKRHQKNLKKSGEMNESKKLIVEPAKSEIEVAEVEKETTPEALPASNSIEQNKIHAVQFPDSQSEEELASENEEKPTVEEPSTELGGEKFDHQKRKMNWVPDGKRMRYTEKELHPTQISPREVPKICDLCNVTCDTRAVFECHLSGKKHLAKVKLLEEHCALTDKGITQSPNHQTRNVNRTDELASVTISEIEIENHEDTSESNDQHLSEFIEQMIMEIVFAGQIPDDTQLEQLSPPI